MRFLSCRFFVLCFGSSVVIGTVQGNYEAMYELLVLDPNTVY
jgi:hypothetical protein